MSTDHELVVDDVNFPSLPTRNNGTAVSSTHVVKPSQAVDMMSDQISSQPSSAGNETDQIPSQPSSAGNETEMPVTDACNVDKKVAEAELKRIIFSMPDRSNQHPMGLVSAPMPVPCAMPWNFVPLPNQSFLPPLTDPHIMQPCNGGVLQQAPPLVWVVPSQLQASNHYMFPPAGQPTPGALLPQHQLHWLPQRPFSERPVRADTSKGYDLPMETVESLQAAFSRLDELEEVVGKRLDRLRAGLGLTVETAGLEESERSPDARAACTSSAVATAACYEEMSIDNGQIPHRKASLSVSLCDTLSSLSSMSCESSDDSSSTSSRKAT